MSETVMIAVLAGDGIGPEVMAATMPVIEKVRDKFSIDFVLQEGLVGGVAIDQLGRALPDETIEICDQSRAVLFGSVGGPKWASLPADQQPERASLLALRKRYELFCNLRPATLHADLTGNSPLNPENIEGGFQILCVRELTSGIYFGQPKGREVRGDDTVAYDTMQYSKKEIERIAKMAFQSARKSRGKVTSIDKANVLDSSKLWREVVSDVHGDYPDCELEHLYVDNAAMQLIKNPRNFDVLLFGNLFGDILSDLCAMATGSLGLLPSASVNEAGFGLYEPAGGSAPDIAGRDVANPIAQVLSFALLCRHSFDRGDIGRAIEAGVRKTLASGIRTVDMGVGASRVVGTREMGDIIAGNI